MESLTFKCGHTREGKNAMPRGDGAKGRGVCCRICKDARNRKWREAQPLERFRAQKKRLRMGRISPLMEKQNGKCAICNRELKYPYEDHDHRCCPIGTSGCVECKRGLLCPSCNGGLHLVEDERLHEAAIAYLKKWA